MADGTGIEWADSTWNIINGCKIVSPGCTNCYAMRLAGTRFRDHPTRKGLTSDSKAGPVWNGAVRFIDDILDQPIRWKRPRLIFVCAHGDLFYEAVDDAWLHRIFAVMALCPQHRFQVLTKRPERMRKFMTELYRTGSPAWCGVSHAIGDIAAMTKLPIQFALDSVDPIVEGLMKNVWLGVSVEDQARADERIPDLLATPAAVRWLSAEPLLGPIHLHDRWAGALDCVVVGGESGPGARPMHPDWVRDIQRQCTITGTHFDFKQWGEWLPCNSINIMRRHQVFDGRGFREEKNWPPALDALRAGKVVVEHVGKKAAGRMLDGETYDGMREIPR